MKPGKSSVAAYYVNCPHCLAPWACPSTGSFLIGRDSVDAVKRTGTRVVKCLDCPHYFNLPANVLALGA